MYMWNARNLYQTIMHKNLHLQPYRIQFTQAFAKIFMNFWIVTQVLLYSGVNNRNQHAYFRTFSNLTGVSYMQLSEDLLGPLMTQALEEE